MHKSIHSGNSLYTHHIDRDDVIITHLHLKYIFH